MANINLLETLFFRGPKKTGYTLASYVVIFILTIVLTTLGAISKAPVIISLGIITFIFSYFVGGKFVGIIYGSVYLFGVVIALINSGETNIFVPNLIVFLTTILLMIIFIKIDNEVEEGDSRQRLIADEMERDKVEYEEQMSKIKDVIAANRFRIKNYRVLNDVGQKLTSTLERKEIVKIISAGTSGIIGSKNVRFDLLIRDDNTETFYPALAHNTEEETVGGTVNIYKKDSFDEWVEKNKFTLYIKSIDEDFRFKTLRKDWIKFKSLIAIPLMNDTQMIGILKFYSQDANVFGKEDVRLLNYLGDLCTTAVQNSVLYQKTKELAIRDGLTGLYMRRYFMERLDDELRRSKQLDEPFSYLMIDIDHFKDCNDTHGHLFGDKVLRLLGEFLKENLRDVDIIGRYGGEEFAVLLPNTAMNGARFVADRLRQNFEKLVIKVNENEGIKLTLSAGGIEFDKKHKLMTIVNNADKALYYSKENGRNKVTFWEDIK